MDPKDSAYDIDLEARLYHMDRESHVLTIQSNSARQSFKWPTDVTDRPDLHTLVSSSKEPFKHKCSTEQFYLSLSDYKPLVNTHCHHFLLSPFTILDYDC
jgi:hypothetical protein